MDNSGNFIRYKIFEGFENLLAFTTTKQTLPDQNARFTGDLPEFFENNRKQLAAILNINSKQLVFPRQTHTNCVVNIQKIPQNEIAETDSLISSKPGICLCVQTADCVPILLFDPHKKVISAIHAGWRGTVKKIAEVVVQKMKDDYHSSPKNILAAIGPSIGPQIYEVGIEVVNAVKKSIPNAEITLSKNNSNKFHFDLWEANKQILLSMGLQAINIEMIGECTFQRTDKYFSARKEGIHTGRLVSGIMLKH